VLTVIAELPPEVTGEVPNDTAAPAGTPDADNVTGSALPDVTAVLTVADAD